MFMQIHTLTSYAAALLNRDDAGLAKRIPFGDATRMRVSSQCHKRHWRDSLHETLQLPGGIRSRGLFEREVLPRVVAGGVDPERATTLVETLLKRLIQGGQDGKNPLRLKQPVLFGKPEADYFVTLLLEAANADEDPVKLLEQRFKTERNNFRALLRAAGQDDLIAGVEGALFGRFVTSDILARTDASVHVAHSFTVHPLDSEVDYFTVVDDLNIEGEAGAAHAGDMELGAGVFYGYVVVDVPLLVSNLTGCDRTRWREVLDDGDADVRDVLSSLIRAITQVTPGAKLGSTAPYSRAECLLLETGTSQPRTLANAYLEALRPSGDVMQGAVAALAAHLASFDAMYGCRERRFVASTRDVSAFGGAESGPVDEMIAQALDSLLGEADV